MRSMFVGAISVLFLVISFPLSTSAGPATAREVEIVMDHVEGSTLPGEGSTKIFSEHGVAIWDAAQSPLSVVEIKVDLMVTGLNMVWGFQPTLIILSRADTEIDFSLIITIPPDFPACTVDYTIIGVWYPVNYPKEVNEIDPIQMRLTVVPFSMVVFRDISDGGTERVSEGEWNELELTLMNDGNIDDTYTVSFENPDSVRISYDPTPIQVPMKEYRKFKFKVYPEGVGTKELVINVGTEHELGNCSGSMSMTLYVDDTNDLVSANILLIVGAAFFAFVIAGISAFLWLWMRARRKKRSKAAKGQG